MVILAISTSTERGSVAVYKQQLLSEVTWCRPFQHGELIVASIDYALQLAGLKKEDLSVIAVDRGPGSFTGARVGVNVARTLGYGLNIPLVSATSLEVLAAQNSQSKKPILSIIDAHKELYFLGVFPKPPKTVKKIFQPLCLSMKQIGAKIKTAHSVVGTLDENQTKVLKKCLGKKYLKEIEDTSAYPKASTLAEMVSASKIEDLKSAWTNIEPLYIRPPEAYEKLAAGQLPNYHKRHAKKSGVSKNGTKRSSN